jgi:hypothetical protein
VSHNHNNKNKEKENNLERKWIPYKLVQFHHSFTHTFFVNQFKSTIATQQIMSNQKSTAAGHSGAAAQAEHASAHSKVSFPYYIINYSVHRLYNKIGNFNSSLKKCF